MSRLTLGIASLVLLASCSPAASSDSPRDMAAEVASLSEAAIAYHAAATAKDAATVVASYDWDAVMVPPNESLVEGITEVQYYRFGFISTPGVSLDFELLRVEVSENGDMGWTLAEGDITIEQDGAEPGQDLVRDFHVWSRQPDGRWTVIVDIWNSGMPTG
ncbi:MAG: nuclear transport factor 2 family protein [Vicinamibacterales bacterium]|nr:nuclear transport factor 2 family protein [Vicinamibacterales bacterium]